MELNFFATTYSYYLLLLFVVFGRTNESEISDPLIGYSTEPVALDKITDPFAVALALMMSTLSE